MQTEEAMKERERFEKWYAQHSGYAHYPDWAEVTARRRRGDWYDTADMNDSYRGWQAALAAQEPVKSDEVPSIDAPFEAWSKKLTMPRHKMCTRDIFHAGFVAAFRMIRASQKGEDRHD